MLSDWIDLQDPNKLLPFFVPFALFLILFFLRGRP